MKRLPGINIQTPWSELLLSGRKTIETRTYPLPKKYEGQDFWLIETPGSSKSFKARVIGIIRFASSKRYMTREDFYMDSDLHLIGPDNSQYCWREDVKKYGWLVDYVEKIEAFDAPVPRGIVYAGPFERAMGG